MIVRHWGTNKHALANVYIQEDAHVILINSHGITDNNQTLKIQNYTIHQYKKDNEQHNGTAMAIRRDISYKLLDNFYTDMIGITIETREGRIYIVTMYIPPRHQHIHYPDFYNILTNRELVYIIGDINARHPYFGHANTNTRGTLLMYLIDREHAVHLEPQFPTFITPRSSTTPDIIPANNRIFHNMHMEPGKLLTPSDHNYIILTLSTTLIQILIKTRPSFQEQIGTNTKKYSRNTILYKIKRHLKTLTEILKFEQTE